MSRTRTKKLVWIVLVGTLVLACWMAVRTTRVPGDLAAARAALARGEPGRVVAETDRWIAGHRGRDDPDMSAAVLLRADALTRLGNPYEALYGYEEVINEHAGTPQLEGAVRAELEIAIKALGVPRTGNGNEVTKDMGEELLVRTIERMPGSDMAERALWELASFYEQGGDPRMAAVAYEKYAKDFPRGPHVAAAQERLRKLNQRP